MKKFKKILTIFFAILAIVLMFGGYGTDGKMYQWIGHPLSIVIIAIKDHIKDANAVGWAIIMITAVFRLILMPLMIQQQLQVSENQIKMNKLKPELDKLQKIAKSAKTPQEQQAASMATMQLYRKNDVSMLGGMSMLTMLIQIPIFSGLYSALYHTEALQKAYFYGVNLNKPSLLFAVIAGAIYLVQAYISMLRLPAEQKKMMSMTLFLSPAMIFLFSMWAMGAIGLYFIVGGIFVLLQTLINHFIRPSVERRVEKNFVIKATADDLLKTPAVIPTNAVSEQIDNVIANNAVTNKAARNAGKQKRKN